MVHMSEGVDNSGAIGLHRDVRRTAERSGRTSYLRGKDILYRFTTIIKATISKGNIKQNGNINNM